MRYMKPVKTPEFLNYLLYIVCALVIAMFIILIMDGCSQLSVSNNFTSGAENVDDSDTLSPSMPTTNNLTIPAVSV